MKAVLLTREPWRRTPRFVIIIPIALYKTSRSPLQKPMGLLGRHSASPSELEKGRSQRSPTTHSEAHPYPEKTVSWPLSPHRYDKAASLW